MNKLNIDAIKQDLKERMAPHVNSMCATDDEVTIAWLVCEYDSLRTRAETVEREFEETKYLLKKSEDDNRALYLLSELVKKERDEAYAKGQIDRTAEVETRLNTLARHLTIHAELSGPAVEDNAFQEAVSDVEVAIKDIFTLPIKERP
jgi:hypothetical protein